MAFSLIYFIILVAICKNTNQNFHDVQRSIKYVYLHIVVAILLIYYSVYTIYLLVLKKWFLDDNKIIVL